jgi:putative NADH-flavin reductase
VKLLILGPTGPLGRQIVAQALDRGHEVTAFARSPQKLDVNHEHLRVLQGDILDDGGTLEAAVRGQDAVISALGVGESFRSRGLISRSVPVIVQAMERQRVQRLVFTSGIILKLDAVPLIPRLLMRLLMRDLMRDKRAGEDVLRASRLDWTLLYPVRLTNGPGTGRYRWGEDVALRGFPTVSRADVADLILARLADASSFGKTLVISS